MLVDRSRHLRYVQIRQITLDYVEKVGSQFLSLRQLFREQHSPPAHGCAEKPNNGGPSHANLRTALGSLGPETRSLRPSFSKPQDFADLVRICK